jgi:hypothetical protein
MLMVRSQKDMDQMESDEVERVRDLRMGDSPSRVK